MDNSLKDKVRIELAEQEVGPQHGGYSVLECRLPKKDLLDVLGSELQDEEKVTLTFTSESLVGPAGEVSLDITPTMEGKISLHSSYAHALYLIMECPATKGSDITLTMSKNSPHLDITSSGEAGFDCKLPAHLDADIEHPEVYGAEDVQDLLSQTEEEGVHYLRPAYTIAPPQSKSLWGCCLMKVSWGVKQLYSRWISEVVGLKNRLITGGGDRKG